MKNTEGISEDLARQLILDELFDLSLYERLRGMRDGELRAMFDKLIPVEEKHLAFWEDFFDYHEHKLGFRRRFKLEIISLACRVFGVVAIHLVLEAIEVYGVRKYLSIAEAYEGKPLGQAVRHILTDELGHEDLIVSQTLARKIYPERVRSIFLGFNDGSVEILGAVSGFYAAFREPALVLVAGLTVAVAGAISMGAGAYASESSEAEVRDIERRKKKFLGQGGEENSAGSPLVSAAIVFVAYLVGSLFPVLPVAFGAASPAASIVFSGTAIIIVSTILAFLSGMRIRHRVLLNLTIITLAVVVTYAIGHATRTFFGVSVI